MIFYSITVIITFIVVLLAIKSEKILNWVCLNTNQDSYKYLQLGMYLLLSIAGAWYITLYIALIILIVNIIEKL